MSYIDLFFSASQQTQQIILLVNVLFVVYYLATINVENKVAIYGGAMLALILLYIAVNFFSGIGVKLFIIFYQLPAIFISTLLYLLYKKLIVKYIPEKPLTTYQIRIPLKNGKNIIVDIIKGVSIQGASGSGKTISTAGWILYWLGFRSMPLLVYDYKNFELTEIVNYFYREATLPIHYFSLGQPDKSIRINPIDPKIIQKKEDLIVMVKSLTDNLIPDTEKGDKFFVEACEGAIAGVVTRLREDYPHYCSYSYLAGIFLTKDAEELVDFISRNLEASIEARAFLDSASSGRQMAGVKATLSNAFRKINIPAVFYLMDRNDIDLAINKTESRCVLSLVNTPKYDDVYSPILGVVAQAVIQSVSDRGREPMCLLIDEAPTIRIQKIQRVVATMRSFGIATVYMIQDKIQTANQMGEAKMKELLANLSTLFFGKTNDPDTAKFFESYFPEVKRKQKAISRGSGVFAKGEARVTVSERDEKQHKSFEMFKRSTGQFFVFDEKGNSFDANIKKPHIEIEEIRSINSITEWELTRYYQVILSNAKNLK
ncbi:type IV secretory system conjugative DNA transfer family protein [Capnocytophaga canimorsus]|uniref:type IV secretory system conjugative DNA transfer family protein n=1 Tax=Capnocytophaga canimorsus TaxID=28188 RepID=UPI0037CCCAE8